MGKMNVSTRKPEPVFCIGSGFLYFAVPFTPYILVPIKADFCNGQREIAEQLYHLYNNNNR